MISPTGYHVHLVAAKCTGMGPGTSATSAGGAVIMMTTRNKSIVLPLVHLQ